MLGLKATLFRVWIPVARVVLAGTAGEHHVGNAIPGGAGKGRIDDDAAPVDDDCQITMDVDQAVDGNGPRSFLAERLLGSLAVDAVDAVNDQGFATRQERTYSPGKEEVLGGAGASALPNHRLDAAIARTPIFQMAHSFNQIY
jgi:hypothetical protein